MASNDLTQLSSVENIEDRAEHLPLRHVEQYRLHRRQTTTVRHLLRAHPVKDSDLFCNAGAECRSQFSRMPLRDRVGRVV